jgi:hypothetical protein
MKSNNPPPTKWFKAKLACGTERHRLYRDGDETPYFIDVASVRAHYSFGDRIGLWAAGHGQEIRRRDGTTYQIAGYLGGFPSISAAKNHAEQRALAS